MTAIDLAMLVLRAWLGVVMLAHGIRHLRRRDRTIGWLESIGFSSVGLQWLAMWSSEIAAGGILMFGFLTPLGAASVVAIATVAFVTVHRDAGFWITARPDEGWEYVATLAAASLALGAIGPGGFSLDAALDIEIDGWAGMAIVAGGAALALVQVAVFRRPGTSA